MATLNLTTYFTEHGEPKTGLSPTVTVWDVSDGSVIVNAQAMTELSGGWYKYSFATFDLTKDYVARAYGGASQPSGEKYAPIDMANAALAGKIDALGTKIDTIDGIVDSILVDTDTTIPATLTTIEGKVDTVDGVSDTIAGRLTAARAGYLDKLNVSGALAHSDAASTYKADVSALATSVEIAALNNITVADILAGVVEGSITIQHALAAILAKAAGQGTGGGTETLVYKNQAGDIDRITYAVADENGNRTTTINVSDL